VKRFVVLTLIASFVSGGLVAGLSTPAAAVTGDNGGNAEAGNGGSSDSN
jgi:hypothetical protein